jgi:hypothetical protein
MKHFLSEHRAIAGFTGAGLALVVAVIYYFVVPQEAADASLIAKFILLYGHSLCWLCLSTASALWGLKNTKVATVLAYAALAIYATFMVTLFVGK